MPPASSAQPKKRMRCKNVDGPETPPRAGSEVALPMLAPGRVLIRASNSARLAALTTPSFPSVTRPSACHRDVTPLPFSSGLSQLTRAKLHELPSVSVFHFGVRLSDRV